MFQWIDFLRQGLTRTLPEDNILGRSRYGDARENLKNLQPFWGRHWRKGAAGGILILVSTLISFPDPLIFRYFVDNVVLGKQLNMLLAVIVLLGVFQVLGMAAGALKQFYFTRFEQEVLLDIQADLLDRTLSLPKSFFDDKQTGYLTSRLLTDVQGLRWFFSSTLVSIVSQILRFIGGVVVLFFLEWRLTLVTLVLLPVLVFSVSFFSRKLRVLSHQSMERQANVQRTVQEWLGANLLIKAFSSEKRTVSAFVEQLRGVQEIALEQSTVSALANMTIDAMPSLARACVLVAGAFLAVRGEWTLGSLLAFQSYLAFVYEPAQFLATANLQLQNALASLERVSALFNIVPEENLTGRKVGRLKGQIDLRHVSFSYDGCENVLQDVSFHVAPGEHVAIVGPSGVGKTTLLSLLLSFYKPTSGEVCFDGEAASAWEVKSLRKRIGYVPQTTTLLAGTILDNLRYGNLEASDAEVIRAAETAGIHDFIRSLPDGYQSLLREGGANLSEGQKQRLALARALVKDPDILVLDEPSSALDNPAERSIYGTLLSLWHGKTLFIVSHRLPASMRFDRIFVLNEKRLVAMGTHEELYQSYPYYRSLVGAPDVARLGLPLEAATTTQP